MIPVVNDDLQIDFEYEELPTRTFRFDIDNQVITNYVDGLEAMKQAIYLILNIERYEYLIYSWDYGVELKDLIGKNISFVIPEVKRRITEALLQDTRISSVNNFNFAKEKKKLNVIFNVKTIFGDVQAESVVMI